MKKNLVQFVPAPEPSPMRGGRGAASCSFLKKFLPIFFFKQWSKMPIEKCRQDAIQGLFQTCTQAAFWEQRIPICIYNIYFLIIIIIVSISLLACIQLGFVFLPLYMALFFVLFFFQKIHHLCENPSMNLVPNVHGVVLRWWQIMLII